MSKSWVIAAFPHATANLPTHTTRVVDTGSSVSGLPAQQRRGPAQLSAGAPAAQCPGLQHSSGAVQLSYQPGHRQLSVRASSTAAAAQLSYQPGHPQLSVRASSTAAARSSSAISRGTRSSVSGSPAQQRRGPAQPSAGAPAAQCPGLQHSSGSPAQLSAGAPAAQCPGFQHGSGAVQLSYQPGFIIHSRLVNNCQAVVLHTANMGARCDPLNLGLGHYVALLRSTDMGCAGGLDMSVPRFMVNDSRSW